MNLGQRFIGVFTNPKETFSFLAEKPIWVDSLIIVLLITFAYGFLIAPFTAKDSFELLENSPKMKQQLRERIGEERFNNYLDNARKEAESTTPAYKIRSGLGVGIMTVIVIFLQSILLLVFSRLFSGSVQGNYPQLLSAMFHANFINQVLGNAVRFILIQAKQSVFKISTGLAIFFPRLEFNSSSYIILNNIDFFQLWMFGLLGYALSAIFKIELKKSLFISYLFWALKTLINIGIGIWSIGRYQ